MMSDQEVRDGLQRLNERVADLEADVRVTKHNVNNIQATFQALASKLERIEERVGMKLDGLASKLEHLLLRSVTTWVTYVVNTIVAVVGVHWAVMLGVLPFVPDVFRMPLALLIGAVVTLPTLIARVWPQPKMQAKVAAKVEEKRDAAG